MLQTASRLLPELSLFLMIAVATHLVMSFAQTLMHYKLGHHPMGGKFFRNHINFHHTYYSKDHLVSRTYHGDEGNNTPFFFIPVFLVGACTYLVLPIDLFVVQVVACAASFYAHVFFDKEYHVEGSRLQRFAWFRRKQELHFVHHAARTGHRERPQMPLRLPACTTFRRKNVSALTLNRLTGRAATLSARGNKTGELCP